MPFSLPCAHADLVAAAVDPLRQPVVEIAYKRNGSFFEFSLCLSRACLGKMMIFNINVLKGPFCLPSSSGYILLSHASSPSLWKIEYLPRPAYVFHIYMYRVQCWVRFKLEGGRPVLSALLRAMKRLDPNETRSRI